MMDMAGRTGTAKGKICIALIKLKALDKMDNNIDARFLNESIKLLEDAYNLLGRKGD